MRDKLQNTTVVIVAHRVFPSIVDDLKKYLLDNHCGELWYIIHEFSTLKTRRSFIEHYRGGELVGTHYGFDYRFIPDPCVNIKDFLYSIHWLLFKVRRADIYIGLGGFNVMAGILLKKILGLKKVVFYTVDYVPLRFTNRVINEIYHWVDKFALLRSTETWNLSTRMAQGREELRGLRQDDYPNQVIVPVGLWLDSVKRYDFDSINKHELIFIGHIVEKAGVQKVLEAMPDILEAIPDFKFRIIGQGAYEETLKEQVGKLGLEPSVIFEGAIPDQQLANEKLARAALAVAMYDRTSDDFSYYADPGKLKTYLAAGLPILLTDVPHNARELERRRCGKVISYDKDSISRAVLWLLSDEKNLREYRENVLAHARDYDWNAIFGSNLDRLL